MLHRTRLTLAAMTVSLGLVITTSPAAVALPDWTRQTTTSENAAARMPKVVDLRYAAHPRFDRVVIDIDGRRPGHVASYVRRLSYDGSGRRIDLRGNKRLALTLTPAYAHGRRGHNLYDGPRLVQVDLPVLRGIAFAGDFEGQVSFGFTTVKKAAYRVFTLRNPSRVVIDWKH